MPTATMSFEEQDLTEEDIAEPEPQVTRRSGRQVNAPDRFTYDKLGEPSQPPFPPLANYTVGEGYKGSRKGAENKNLSFLMQLNWKRALQLVKSPTLHRYLLAASDFDPENGTIEDLHPMALATMANAEDNPTWEEAMNGPDRDGYWSRNG